MGVTGGDARKASRHAPAINLGAFGAPRYDAACIDDFAKRKCVVNAARMHRILGALEVVAIS